MTDARRNRPKKSKRRSGEQPSEARSSRAEKRPASAAPSPEVASAEAEKAAAEAAEAELALARNLGLWLPAVTVAAAGIVGGLFSAGPAILVLGVGALIGGIAFFWGSVRSLAGEAPISPHLLSAAPRGLGGVDAAAEQKRLVLRSLKDLENERNVGKISEEDYRELADTYRARAKEILRGMDEAVAPLRGEAERMADAYLAKRGVTVGSKGAVAGADAVAVADADADADAVAVADAGEDDGADVAPKTCASCGTENDEDAAFCKKCGAKLADADADADADAGDDEEDDDA